jgi:uncharacterized protein (TIGR02452 family)
MSKRSARAQIALETLGILECGHYISPAGRRVSVADELEAARAGSLLYTPEQLEALAVEVGRRLPGRVAAPTPFAVVNETTLHAARRLLAAEGAPRVLALNFASARHPGGGFRSGSQAQEESLARASGLYSCLTRHRTMYEANERFASCLYTDHMIYSPNVPVFRDDDDVLLEQPCLLSFVTAPAVNAGAVRDRERPQLGPVMRARIEKVLAVAVKHSYEAVVLGAWGCGVFRNDPEEVAGWFAEHLTGGGAYRTAFTRVVFAVLDPSTTGANIRPFLRRFGTLS